MELGENLRANFGYQSTELLTRHGADINQQRRGRKNQKRNKKSDEIIAVG